MSAPVEFLLLGPLEARRDGVPLRLGSLKHRILLAKLLLRANQPVSTDELIDAVWGETPPATVRQSLQNHIAALRRALGSDLLITRDPGYMIQISPDQLDFERFQRLTLEGRQALAEADPERAARLLREGLRLWRGPALADVRNATGDDDWPELVGIDELHLAAFEARIEADLHLGRHRELIPELERFIRHYPLRENLHQHLMLALYRSGRQADALSAYRSARRTLINELGIEPSVGLQRLEQAILAQDPALELLGPVRAETPVAAAAVPSTAVEAGASAPSPAEAPAPAPAPATPATERKLVTVLFVEAVEPAGEERDPEDASSTLERHLERVHAEIESFGGVIGQVIGGTTMAVFGVPVTREDDPERAVRAGLAIRDALAESHGTGEIELRVAVATGEALVTVATSGQPRVAGDLVTTCQRLQQAAPAGTVLVSEATERATSKVISYGPESMLSLAGRARPVTVWSALETRSRTGLDALVDSPVALVGREREVKTLVGASRASREDGRPRVVTLVGAPGIGKSRLIAELWRSNEEEDDLITWRQGRTPPYGEGVTFWALGEIVKAEAGILETDTAERVDRKLSQADGHALADDPGAAARVTGHLRLLLGAGKDEPLQAGRQEEAFAAWRRFFYGMAAHRPLVLVIEDLHNADDALLDFLESMADPAGRPAGPVPLLVVLAGRSELLERRPNWCAGKPDATTVNVEPLSESDTVKLLNALLEYHGLPSRVGPQLVAKVGGNPLFAEEYVRMLRDRGLVGEGAEAPTSTPALEGAGRSPSELPLPETVHAIIAARLDALRSEEKSVLQDASVLGQVGWASAIAAIGGHDRMQLETSLERLIAKEFIYRSAHSSIRGEREYGFRHELIRDVAYGQIPRADRAGKHRRAAEWLQSLATDLPEDETERRIATRTELLAYHYEQAIAFARAARQDEAELTEPARLALRDAGDRVTKLGVHNAAARYYARALDLWPSDDPERPELEFRAGKAALYSDGTGESLLTSARDGFLAAGNRDRAAEAEILLFELTQVRGQQERAVHLDRALAMVKGAPPSPSKAEVLRLAMQHFMIADRHAEALEIAREALGMARLLGLRDVEASTLGMIGVARVYGGDPGGIADLERCIAIYEDLASTGLVSWSINLATALSVLGDLSRCFETRTNALRAAERFGSVRWIQWIELELVVDRYWRGLWDEVVQVVEAVVSQSVSAPPHYLEPWCRVARGRILLAHGEVEGAVSDSRAALEQARELADPQALDPALVFSARAMLASGHSDEAEKIINEFLGGLNGRLLKPETGVDLAIVMAALGIPFDALDAVALASRWLDAVRAFVTGDPRRAAEIYAKIGSRPDEAAARLEAARQLLAAGREAEGQAELAAARSFYQEVGATAYLEAASHILASV